MAERRYGFLPKKHGWKFASLNMQGMYFNQHNTKDLISPHSVIQTATIHAEALGKIAK